MLDCLSLSVVLTTRLAFRAGTKYAMLHRPDHVDGHAMFKAFVADHHLLLQELVGD